MSGYRFNINGKEYDVLVKKIDGAEAVVEVNGKEYSVGLESRAEESGTPETGDAGEVRTVVSPLPGVVLDVFVNEGQRVKKGTRIAVIEAMKMENDILSPRDGTVTSVSIRKGDSILEGSEIAVIA